MGDLEIKRHSFDLAKNRLKKFSEKKEAELEIEEVRTSGGFLGLGDHKVTGYELNERLETIQGHFIAVNKINNAVIKEFREVYNALDALDKDYITSIVANVKAIEKTSNDVRVQQETLKNHNEKLEKQQSKLDAHQTEIDKSVSNISRIVTAIKRFNEKLESYDHLTDIDKIWNDCQKWHHDISKLSSSLSTALTAGEKNEKDVTAIRQALNAVGDKIAQLSQSLIEQASSMKSVVAFVNGLDAITHLKDVDAMWDALRKACASLDNLSSELDAANSVVEKQQHEIEDIIAFIESISKCEHLRDIDVMWSKVEDDGKRLDELVAKNADIVEAIAENKSNIVILNDYKKELATIAHLKDLDSLWESAEKHTDLIKELQDQDEESRRIIQHNKSLFDQTLATEKEKTDTALQMLNKKVQYAYWIAGGSATLALIELFVILLGG